MGPVKTAMLGLLLLLLGAAPAAAQGPPPDERAAAQAFADAGSRFTRAWDGLDEEDPVDAALEEPGCERVLREAPDRRAGVVGVQIILGFAIRTFADRIKPAFAQFRTDLANILTRDPALISGRAAMRRIGRAYAALPPAGDLCADLRAWRKAGYPRAAGRRAMSEIDHLLGAITRGALRKISAAADRMRALGVSPEQADAWEGDGPAAAAAQAARAAS